jgi:hypothetical protein
MPSNLFSVHGLNHLALKSTTLISQCPTKVIDLLDKLNGTPLVAALDLFSGCRQTFAS